MRRFSTTALAIGTCLSAATLTFSSPTAASPNAATSAGAADESTLTCTQKVFTGLTGKLYMCPWDDGRICVFGHLRASTPANGNTRLRVQMGSYSQEWNICATDRPIDTDYQYGGAVETSVVSSTTITC
ncbi:hypothetical protein OHA63_30650 [Streptomyces anulatus]|uniref:hypothetical protein n=1 Tax=Streptomyces anulatus TaxID=1892 RepID=UPI002E37E689|nr:hypothetical protein [Streptomyces anulatus]